MSIPIEIFDKCVLDDYIILGRLSAVPYDPIIKLRVNIETYFLLFDQTIGDKI